MIGKRIDKTILNVRAKFLRNCVPDTIERRSLEYSGLRNRIKGFVEVKSWTDDKQKRYEGFSCYQVPVFKIMIPCSKLFVCIWSIDGVVDKGISRRVQLEASVDVVVIDVLIKIKFEFGGRREMDRGSSGNKVLRNYTTVEGGKGHFKVK